MATDWKEVEQAAREQAAADVSALRTVPLEYGQYVAWAVTARVGSATHGVSSLHRVGTPKGNVAYTTCEVPIPDPLLWFPLSPALIRTMTRCGFCEAAHAHGLLGNVA